MYALTIAQPWAWLIVHGHKQSEHRSWRTAVRGPLLIHAAVRRDVLHAVYRDGGRRRRRLPVSPDDLPLGALVGVVDLVDCRPVRRTDHTRPAYRWKLAGATVFDRPIPFRGAQGLFHVPPSIVPINTCSP